MSKRILVTNDDGISAEGIARLARAAKAHGEVWVVAPAQQRSAASHYITLHKYLDILPVSDFPVKDVKAFSCSGTPADCVRVACQYLLPEKPDLVLSGINHGYNVASDIQYSGTVGAAFEGWFQGVRSIAFSEGTKGTGAVTDHYLEGILAELAEKDPGENKIWNVNFPDCPLAECKGVLYDRTVSHGIFYHDHYERQEELEGGGARLVLVADYHEEAEEGTDMHAVVDKYVSVGTVNNIGYH